MNVSYPPAYPDVYPEVSLDAQGNGEDLDLTPEEKVNLLSGLEAVVRLSVLSIPPNSYHPHSMSCRETRTRGWP